MSEKESEENTTPIEFIILQSEREIYQIPPDQDAYFTNAELLNIQPDSIGKTVSLTIDYEILYAISESELSDDAEHPPRKAVEHLEIVIPIGESNEKPILLQFCPNMNPTFHVSGPADVKLTGFMTPSAINDEEEENDEEESETNIKKANKNTLKTNTNVEHLDKNDPSKEDEVLSPSAEEEEEEEENEPKTDEKENEEAE